MKNSAGIFMLGLSFLIFTSVISCKKEAPKTAPSVTTASLTNITPTGVSCGGNVTDDGGAMVTARGVCWSLNQNPTVTDNHSTDGSGKGSFSTIISGLQSGTTYYFRAYATNSVGTSYGSQVSTATSATAPTVTTVSVNSVTTSSASSGGNVTSNGGGEISQKGVCWGTAQNPTVDGSKTENGTGSQAFTSNISGLNPNTKYYVRAYAVNSAGTSYGIEVSFTTKGVETLAENEEMFPGVSGTPATAIFDGETVNCNEVNGFKVYQGDIILSAPEDQQTKGVAITSTINYWPANRVFYKTDNKVSKTKIKAAIAAIESKTKLKFIPSISDDHYVKFVWDESGCSSYVGRIGGEQKIWLADWATTGTIIHEICHAIGLKHEQSRPDRDKYIIVIDTNIIKGKEHNFEKMSKGNVQPADTFDFNSIMLYTSTAFSKNDKPTLVKKSDKSAWESNRDNLSEEDINMINKIYPTTTAAPYINIDEVGIVPGGAYILEADVLDDGGSPVTMRGICWTTDGTTPTLNNQYRTSGTGSGKFQIRFDNLVSGVNYKYKAFAVNSIGTAYTNYSLVYTHPSLATVTTGSLTDIASTTAICQSNSVTTDGLLPL
ncbi:MAG: M12 family metallopeptidase, partial [Bacteroidales bacterium]|nr:M12 family metallopeptidase [Bacteroidales bacterium]